VENCPDWMKTKRKGRKEEENAIDFFIIIFQDNVMDVNELSRN
jgi:hypothetical protein